MSFMFEQHVKFTSRHSFTSDGFIYPIRNDF